MNIPRRTSLFEDQWDMWNKFMIFLYFTRRYRIRISSLLVILAMVSTQLPDTFRCFCSNYRSSISTRRIECCLLTFWSGSIGLWPDMNISLCLNKTIYFFVDIIKYFEQSILADVGHAPNWGTDIGHLLGHIHRVIGSPYISCKKSYLFCSFFQ